MNILEKYLNQNKVTRYQVSKMSDVYQSTLQKAVNSKSGSNGLSGKILKAVALTLNKTPGQVLDEIITLENQQK